MIVSFRDKWLRNYYINNKRSKRIPAYIDVRLFRKLQIIDDASDEIDLRSPPGNQFEKLSGHLAGKCSIRVNRQWRLIFLWNAEQKEVR